MLRIKKPAAEFSAVRQAKDMNIVFTALPNTFRHKQYQYLEMHECKVISAGTCEQIIISDLPEHHQDALPTILSQGDMKGMTYRLQKY